MAITTLVKLDVQNLSNRKHFLFPNLPRTNKFFETPINIKKKKKKKKKKKNKKEKKKKKKNIK